MNKVSILKFKSLSSTNTYAKENVSSLPIPCIITAETQTAGRGRRGNSFYSPNGTGLYMTAVFKAPTKCDLLTPVAAVSVCNVLEKHGLFPQIKWVNDIFIDGFKVCGILTEIFKSDDEFYIALGIGINVTTESFPDDLKFASSLKKDIDKDILAKEITDIILDYCDSPDDKTVIEEYRKRLFIIDKDITFCKNNIPFSATVKGINDLCNLIVTLEDGTEEILSSGEISIKL